MTEKEPKMVDRWARNEIVANYYQHDARRHTILVIVPIAHPWSQKFLFARRDQWVAYDGVIYLRLPDGRLAVGRERAQIDEAEARNELEELITAAQDSDGVFFKEEGET